MSVVKRIGKSDALRGVLCWLVAQYIRLCWWTGRWTVQGHEGMNRLREEGKPFIVAFWHGRILMMPKTWPGGPFNMLISQHRDGQLISRTVAHFGIKTVAGSTSRGGAAALRAMLRFLKNGEVVGMTPDGPRGPRMRLSSGIINVARISGVPIFPSTYSCQGWILGSWDRFLIPRLFGRGIHLWGEPIYVARDDDDDKLRLKVEDAMNRLVDDADRYTGIGPVSPDPLPSGSAQTSEAIS